MDKSYVTMETKFCPISKKEWETGTILLDKRLREKFDRTCCTGYELHPDVRDDWMLLLEAEEDRKLTGRFIAIKFEPFKQLFPDVPIHEEHLALIDNETFAAIEAMVPSGEQGEYAH